MPNVLGLPPIGDANATALILGSMPGCRSLQMRQYYANRRNAFWPIMGELIGASPDLPYDARVEVVKSAGIALWDVLAACERSGSLDAGIRKPAPNDFITFFRSHPAILQVFFNGAVAEKLFCRHVWNFPGPLPLRYRRLPSTSLAHASMSYQQKLEAWGVVAKPSRPAAPAAPSARE